MKYIITIKGKIFNYADTIEEAEKIIKLAEIADKEDGLYEKGLYKIETKI